LEAGAWSSCDTCGFRASSIGRVASASSQIDNGFEYHYRIVAEAAARYQNASRAYAEASSAAQSSAQTAFDGFGEALAVLDTPRIHPKPPGRKGCIAFAFDLSSRQIPTAFSSSFVAGGKVLPPRMALSAAALALDEPSEGRTVLSSFLERARANEGDSGWGSGLDIFGGVLGLWGDTLLAYNDGMEGFCTAVGSFLRSIPLVKATPLASWAEDALRSAIRGVGLEGVELGAPKPIIVNSIYVIRAGDSQALSLIGSAKETYGSLPGFGVGDAVTDIFDGVLVEIEQRSTGFLESEITLFTIALGDWPGAPRIPVTVQLPPALVQRGSGIIGDALGRVRSWAGGG
jgi:hypothetical protein